MRFAIAHPRELFSRKSLGADLKAGIVLGIEGVPDNLSSGVLAAVNPVAAVYAGIFGIAGAALFSSSALMPVQATGAMSIIVRDSGVGQFSDPITALATLTILTGIVMLIAGVLRLGSLVRFVSHSVISGFLAAVGVNIILGQFADITGYQAEGNRIVAALSTLIHIAQWDWSPTIIGLGTAAAILVLRRTRLAGMGYVVAIVLAWIAAYLVNRGGGSVAVVADIAEVPRGLPLPVLPDLTQILPLLLPALSLAFVGLVQGAGVAAGVDNPDGSRADASQDFVGQGVGNITSGLFRGMPVGGSASGAVLMRTVGARSRGALFFTSIVMAVLIVSLSSVVGQVPLSGLAGMLLVVGADTVPVAKVVRTIQTGAVPVVVMVTTFLLTLVIPLQYAVLVGVGVSVVLFVIGESARLDLKQLLLDADGGVREVDPPEVLGNGEVVVIQPYGTVFFASADSLVDQLPAVGSATHRSVLILRLRGEQAPSATLLDALVRYGKRLNEADSRLVVVTTSDELIENLREAEPDAPEGHRVYLGTDRVGATVRRAYADAQAWVAGE